MAARCSVFIATTLDGFISRSDGSIDWLNAANEGVPLGEDCGYQKFISTVDAIVMGRNTYEQALSFAEWPYGPMPVIVLSKRLPAADRERRPTVSVSREDPATAVARLTAEGMRHLYVDGGLTIQSFLAAGLIDEITITVIPVLIGTGRTLFGPLSSDIRLQRLATIPFDFGYVQTTYRVVK